MSQPTNNDLLNSLLDVSALTASGLTSYGTSEVTSLRKAGKIDEAYQKAKERLAKEPENVWAKRDMSWVLYSYLKANANLEKLDVFVGYLKELHELKLPQDEVMLFVEAPIKLTTSGRGKLTTCFAGEDLVVQVYQG